MGRGMWCLCGREEVYAGFYWRSLKEIDHLENLGVDGE
jgi:hypothetical protein